MADDLQDQIAAMLDYDSGSGSGGGDDADDGGASEGSGGDPPADSEGAEAQGSEEASSQDSDDTPGGEEGSTEGAEASSGEGEEGSLEEENARLRERLETVLRANQEPVEAAPVLPKVLDQFDFDPFEGEDVEQLVEDPAKLKATVTNAFQRFSEALRESMVKNLPSLVKSYATETIGVNERAREFYEAHEDLKPYKRYVMFKMNELSAAEPNKGLDELLGATADGVRKDLGLKEKAERGARDKPPLKQRSSASSRRSQRAEDTLSDMQKEIDAMEKALEV